MQNMVHLKLESFQSATQFFSFPCLFKYESLAQMEARDNQISVCMLALSSDSVLYFGYPWINSFNS